jgi:hypothetical protein
MDARLGGSGLLCAARSALSSYYHRNTQELAVQNISNSILSLWRSPKLYRDPIDSSQRSAAPQRFLRVFRRSDRPIPPANACGHAASRRTSCNACAPKLFAGGGHLSSVAHQCPLATPDATMLVCTVEHLLRARQTLQIPQTTPFRTRSTLFRCWRTGCESRVGCVYYSCDRTDCDRTELTVSQRSRTYLRNILKAGQYKNTAASYLL